MDVGKFTNTVSTAANTYAAKEAKETKDVKKTGAPGRTIGQAKLSEEGKKYYEELRAKYKDMEFILVSSDMKEMAKANAGKFAKPDKTVVLIDEAKIERMATDEEFRKQYEGILENAQKQLPQLQKEVGNNPNLKGFGIQVNDDGSTSFFAVMNKSFDKQAELIEEKRAEKKAEKKAAEKKAQKEAQAERLEGKKADKQEDVTVIYANSIEELKQKITDYEFSLRADTIRTDAEKSVGKFIDFKG